MLLIKGECCQHPDLLCVNMLAYCRGLVVTCFEHFSHFPVVIAQVHDCVTISNFRRWLQSEYLSNLAGRDVDNVADEVRGDAYSRGTPERTSKETNSPNLP